MENIFNQDFQEFLRSLNKFEVEYLLVGGYAVVLYGYHRTTGDLDIWVNPTETNYSKLNLAFGEFGLPIGLIPLDSFLDVNELDVFTFGRPPVAIDIMTKVKGLQFDSVYKESDTRIHEGLAIKLIHYKSLIVAKKSAGRLKDLNDIQKLEEE